MQFWQFFKKTLQQSFLCNKFHLWLNDSAVSVSQAFYLLTSKILIHNFYQLEAWSKIFNLAALYPEGLMFLIFPLICHLFIVDFALSHYKQQWPLGLPSGSFGWNSKTYVKLWMSMLLIKYVGVKKSTPPSFLSPKVENLPKILLLPPSVPSNKLERDWQT